MASSSVPARFTTRSIPNLLQDEGSCAPTSDSRLSHEKFVMEAFQVAALAHISTPAWGGFRGFAPARFEVDKVPARRGVRFLLGAAPGGSGKLAFETETCAPASTTQNGALVTVQPVADNSLVRRTLADRAAKQSRKERWIEGSRHSERHFVNKNGHRIYTQQWLPDGTPMKAVVVVLHGLNEHSGRYKHLAKELTRKGYGVFGMDWYGHGRSDGLHGFVDRLDNTVRDAGSYLRMVKRQHPGVPCFLYGHSTGAAIALKAVRSSPKNELAGLVLTAPAISITPPHPVLATLLPIAAEVAPTLQVASANRSHIKVSRDPASLLDKYSDPLVYTGSIRLRTGSEVLRIASDVRKQLHTVRHPFLVCHGTDDEVTNPEGSEELYQKAPVKNKRINLYKGCLHDLLLEPEKDQVLTDVVSWMDQQLSLRAKARGQLAIEKRRDGRGVREMGEPEVVERC